MLLCTSRVLLSSKLFRVTPWISSSNQSKIKRAADVVRQQHPDTEDQRHPHSLAPAAAPLVSRQAHGTKMAMSPAKNMGSAGD